MTQKLKVAFITSINSEGGLAKATYTLIRELLKDNQLRIGLLTLGTESVKTKELRKLGCEILSVPLKSGRDLTHLLATIKYLKKYKIHHFHTVIPPFVVASVLCKNISRIYTNRGGHHKHRPLVETIIMGFLLRHFFSAFTGNTKYATKIASERFKIPLEKFSVTYNGMDFSEIVAKYPRKEFRISNKLHKYLVIGTVSLLARDKNVERLLKGVSMLKNIQYRVLIIGDGPGKQNLIKETKHLNIEDKTIFKGEQMPPYDFMNIMDIFVCPSISQSFGNAIVEAMALGIPVIAFSDCGGILEHISNEKTGFIVNNEKELTQCFQKIAANKKWVEKISRAGSSFVRNKYTLNKMAETYKKVYRNYI